MCISKQVTSVRVGARVLAFAAAVAVSVPAVSSGLGASAQEAGGVEAKVAEQLALRVRAELATLPETAAVEEREAAIVFIVSQDSIPLDTAIAALTMVEGVPGVPPLTRTAIANVKIALLRKKIGRGTAALGGGNGFGSSSFSGPVVGGGGGGSDYTP